VLTRRGVRGAANGAVAVRGAVSWAVFQLDEPPPTQVTLVLPAHPARPGTHYRL